MKKESVAIAILSLALFSQIGHSQEGVERLLSQEHRPSVQDMLRELDPWPQDNPFDRTSLQSESVGSILQEIPKKVAALERAFPGATWAPLGRDSVVIGDILAAFYLSLGQGQRVEWLPLSRPSFERVEEDVLRRFLAQHGYDAQQPGPHPFIIIDWTSYRPHSQSAQLLRAGYTLFQEGGGDVRDLIPWFNIVTLFQRGHVLDEFVDARLERIAEEATLLPKEIFSIPGIASVSFVRDTQMRDPPMDRTATRHRGG